MSLKCEEVSLSAHLSNPELVAPPESSLSGNQTELDESNSLSRSENLELLEESEYQWKLMRYHEAGHAVVAHVLGFRPMYIDNDVTRIDRRNVKFSLGRDLIFRTPETRERAGQAAVIYIAGPAAEAKISGKSLVDVRAKSNFILDDGEVGDYYGVNLLLERVMGHSAFEYSEEVRDQQLFLWEARATAILNTGSVWAAVESVADQLERQFGTLGRDGLLAAIERGFSSYFETHS